MAVILLLVLRGAAERPGMDALLCRSERLLDGRSGKSGSFDSGEITVAASVSRCSRVLHGIRLSIDHITFIGNDYSEISILPEHKVILTTEYEEVFPGDRIKVKGIFTPFEEASNPGQFDAKSWYYAQNTVGNLRKAQILEVIPAKGSWKYTLQRIRRLFWDSYTKILPEKEARILSAISLGEKNTLDDTWKILYQEGGIAHILAVSSLHITMIGMAVYRVLRKCRLRIAGAACVSGMIVVSYAVMTGESVSAMRAAVLFLFWLGSQISGRRYDLPTGLAAAAVLILGENTRHLNEAAFLLSFGAVLSLVCFVPAAAKTCSLHHRAVQPFLSSAGVWIGTLPITLFFFYQTSPWSILVNIAVVALLSSVMAMGFLAAAVGRFSYAAGAFLASPVYYLLGLFEELCLFQQKLPFPVWVAGRPSVFAVFVYYLLWGASLAVLRWMEKKQISAAVRRLCLAVCAAAGILVIGMRIPLQSLEVISLDVGQGDCALLRFPDGIHALIDCGSSSEQKIWQYRVGQAVRYYGIRKLDYVFLSHSDADHINGIEQFLASYEAGFGSRNIHGITVGTIVLPDTADTEAFGRLRILAKQCEISVCTVGEGVCFSNYEKHTEKAEEQQWELRCLWPVPQDRTGDANEDSMVLMLRYGAFRMLFTGDIGTETERKLVRYAGDLQADVLKAAHHGSGGSSDALFLDAVRPQITVVSCAADNPYGHPAPEALRRMEEAGSRILITAETGAIRILTDGVSYSAQTYRDIFRKKI